MADAKSKSGAGKSGSRESVRRSASRGNRASRALEVADSTRNTRSRNSAAKSRDNKTDKDTVEVKVILDDGAKSRSQKRALSKSGERGNDDRKESKVKSIGEKVNVTLDEGAKSRSQNGALSTSGERGKVDRKESKVKSIVEKKHKRISAKHKAKNSIVVKAQEKITAMKRTKGLEEFKSREEMQEENKRDPIKDSKRKAPTNVKGKLEDKQETMKTDCLDINTDQKSEPTGTDITANTTVTEAEQSLNVADKDVSLEAENDGKDNSVYNEIRSENIGDKDTEMSEVLTEANVSNERHQEFSQLFDDDLGNMEDEMLELDEENEEETIEGDGEMAEAEPKPYSHYPESLLKQFFEAYLAKEGNSDKAGIIGEW